MFNVRILSASFLFLFSMHVWPQPLSMDVQLSQMSSQELSALARAGNAEAQYYLGRSAHIAGDNAVAKMWLEAAAKKNNVSAMLLLSDSAYSLTSKDKHRWYEKIAELGDAQGMLFNAMQYEEDGDYRQAYVWYVLTNRVLSEKLTLCKWDAPECYDPTHQGMMEKLSMRLNTEERKAAQVEADVLYRGIFNK
ncbi:hypothetical protein SOASR030_03860 [Leminorella grimontii]|uniref:Sel1 repeat family protein n=1 Tax=Leminorella grimontii TaxID=82981 RepID=A0AAV5MZC7_9GAMM|nr:sel1 repeat family protein [Leminorella grimontii]GKX54274.1 hypothetical protein SOASR030_03860 [Leminorella grimontii]VFS59623.1 Uncharacterised protein [Leminorella grimontii]